MTPIGHTDKRGYTTVQPTDAEIEKYVARKGHKPGIGMVQCGDCGARIWNSGFARSSHDRGKACKTRAAQNQAMRERLTAKPAEQCRTEGDGLSIRTSLRTVHAEVCTCKPEQPKPAVKADPETLMAAIATMANRMAMSSQEAGLASTTNGTWKRHLDACSRQRQAMHRLMDALAVALNGNTPMWGWRHTLMVIRDSNRREAMRAATETANPRP